LDLAELERDLLLQALRRVAGNRSRAARLLGLTRHQIRHRLAKLDDSVRPAWRPANQTAR
jgi:DNA-binding protein Fis